MEMSAETERGLAFFNSPTPRDSAAARAMAWKANVTSRVAYYVSLALVGTIGAIILYNARTASELLGGGIGVVFVWLLYAGPLYVNRRRAMSKFEKVALEGSVAEGRVVGSTAMVYAGGPINRVTVDFADSKGNAWQVGVDIASAKPVHQEGDIVQVLHHPDVAGLALLASEHLEPQAARLMTAEKAATRSRVKRIIVGVVIGSVLFVGLLFWAASGH